MKPALRTLFCVVLIAVALPAVAAEDDGGEEIYPIVFPVVGEHRFQDDYLAQRSHGPHYALDIMADKMTPVVAAADGTVGWMSENRTYQCGNEPESPSFSLKLEHDDGYQSWYIHLNNDTPGTDDGQGVGYAPGIEPGARVAAGQLIGWVGDSGNAECVASHLHFQLHYPTDKRFNPYQSLLAATHVNPIAADEIFFYRDDGLFRYYDINTDGTLGSPLAAGDNYTRNWSTITSLNLDGDGDDEMFFYRDDGLFRYYDIRPDGSIPSPLTAGDEYTTGWDSITAIDLDGDGQDEMFFYREDGLYRFYEVRADGTIPKPLRAGSDYTTGWSSITAIDLNGDGQDEMFFYRDDGLYRYYDIKPDGSLGSPIRADSDYPQDWDSITAIDLNGDDHDEIFFYRSDGTFAFYPITSDGVLGDAILSGDDYTTGWDSIASVGLDG